jgi:hypothetical protein
MKKLPAFLLMIYISLFLWAQDDDTKDFASRIWEPGNIEDEEETEEPAPFRLKNRTLEFSILNISVDVANNFITAKDTFRSPFYIIKNIDDIKQDPTLIYRDDIVIDLDDFFSGFKFNFNTVIKPFSFNFNHNDQWGFGLDIGHINATGNVLLSGTMMRLQKAKDEKFGVGAAIFADVGIPIFFYYDEVKIKIRPSAYVPFLYTEPGVTYTSKDIDEDGTRGDGTQFKVRYDMRLYSLVDMNEDIMQGMKDNVRGIPGNNLGYDFRLCLEYPWDYDLDVGVDIVNIPVPFAAARLYHYAQLDGKAFLDTSFVDLADLANGEDIPKDAYDYPDNPKIKSGYDSDGKKIYRPFAMLFYAHYRPSEESDTLTLIPSLGFSLNWLYPQIFALEGGLSARFDFANILIPVFGINYNDRRWKNSIDIILNLRAFELDFGLSTQSQDFIKSFKGAGLGVNFGIKLGW